MGYCGEQWPVLRKPLGFRSHTGLKEKAFGGSRTFLKFRVGIPDSISLGHQFRCPRDIVFRLQPRLLAHFEARHAMGTGASQSAKPQTKFPAEEFFEAEFQLRNNVGHGKALDGPAFFQDI